MRKEDYLSLRQQLAAQGLFSASNGFGLFIFGLEILLFAAGFILLLQLQPWSWSFIALQILLGTSIFRFFVLLHDCGHYSLFQNRSLNTLFGSLASVFCLTPFVAWREVHFEHHRWVGLVDKDPTAAGLVTFEEKQQHSKFTVALLRVIWILRLPIPAISFTINVLWLYPLRLWREGHRTKIRAALVSAITTLVPHALLLAWFGIADYFTYFAPILAFSFVWYEMINLTHHAGLYPHRSDSHPQPLALHEQAAVSRSAKMPTWLSAMLCYHFNLHTEHHLFPTVPWHHLPAVEKILEAMKMPDYQGVGFPSFNNALRRADPVAILLNQLPDELVWMQSAESRLKPTGR